MKGFLRHTFFLVLVIVLSFWTVKPLFNSGFFPMHDDTQPARVYEMAQALSSGQFPVRWVGNLGYGYGYPLFNFYAPLPYYIGSFFYLLGFDALIATKIMFFLGIVLAGITMFLLLDNLFGDFPALLGSVLYMYAPYHGLDAYVRGAVGEFYALAFLPLVLLGIYKIISQGSPGRSPSGHLPGVTKLLLEGVFRSKQGIVIGALGFACVLLSHNVLGMTTGYFLILSLLIYFLYLIIKHKKLSVICYLLSVICLGLGLSAFFVLPAIFEKDFTRVNMLTSGSSNFNHHFVYLDQLWSSPWGYGGSAPGRSDGMSFMVGKIHLLLGLLSVPMVWFFYKKKKISRLHLKFYLISAVLFLVSVFLMLPVSKFIWNLLPGFPYVQYPWRFLVYTILSLSVMVPLILIPLRKISKLIFCTILIILVIWFNSRYFSPQTVFPVNDSNYTNTSLLNYKISKISDEYMPKDFAIPVGEDEVAVHGVLDTPNISVNQILEELPTRKIYNIFAKEQTKVVAQIAYFPGWKGYIDGSQVSISSTHGRITIDLSAGRHTIEFKFTDTPVRILANTISILSLFLVLYIIVFVKPIYVKKKHS